MGFYVISLMFGGAVVGWMYFVGASTGTGIYSAIRPQWPHILIGGLVAAVAISIIGRLRALRHQEYARLFKTEIVYKNRQREITMLLDTGNRLYSIGDARPVILAERRELAQLLDPELQEVIDKYLKCGTLNIGGNIASCVAERLVLLPFRTISGRKILLGFRPDQIIIHTRQGPVIAEAVVGVCHNALPFQAPYSGLLHPDLVEYGSVKPSSQTQSCRASVIMQPLREENQCGSSGR